MEDTIDIATIVTTILQRDLEIQIAPMAGISIAEIGTVMTEDLTFLLSLMAMVLEPDLTINGHTMNPMTIILEIDGAIVIPSIIITSHGGALTDKSV